MNSSYGGALTLSRYGSLASPASNSTEVAVCRK